MAINWGHFKFEPIELLSTWEPPSVGGGIYAIMFKKDHVNKPDTYAVLYFGETSKFSTRGIDDTHHKYNCWKFHAYQTELYVSVAYFFTEGQRKQAEKLLITKYKPECNEEYT